MQAQRTTVNVDASELIENVRNIEELLLLMGEADLSHCEGSEADLRERVGQTMAWLFGQGNLAAYATGRSMDDLPWCEGDVTAARTGALTCRQEEGC